jgi:hypothetical protein
MRWATDRLIHDHLSWRDKNLALLIVHLHVEPAAAAGVTGGPD